MLRIIKKIFKNKQEINKTETQRLRDKGIKIGDDTMVTGSFIDLMCPELITIGNHTIITGSTVLVHDSSIIRGLGYRKIGKVTIGDYCFISVGCVILPGTHIPNKVIIGARCTIKGILEQNSLYIANEHGMPVKISTYDEYLSKHRKNIEEKTFVWDKPLNEMTKEERAQLAEHLPEGTTGYSKPPKSLDLFK